jgi:toxin ParE1/3/4
VGLILIYSKTAKRDMDEIYGFIRRNSLYYAQKEIKSIRIATQKLKIDPLLGKKFEASDDELTRELIYKSYRIIYDIIPGKKITILTIHHHSRSLTNNPED